MGMTGSGIPLAISAKPTHEFRPRGYLYKKSKKHLGLQLTVLVGGDYIRLTNEGGAPLAAKQFASETALCENSREPRKRHSDGPEATSGLGHDIA